MERELETLEAKLRNQLSPLYGLADIILLLDENPDLKPILIQQAKQSQLNMKKIDLLLKGIEAKTEDLPDVLRQAFYAGCESRNEESQTENFEESFEKWLSNPSDMKRKQVSTSYLILSGEGNTDTEHQFCMECKALKEADHYFDNFKRGKFIETNLFIYEAKKIREA